MMDLDQELEIAQACLDQYSLDLKRVENMANEYGLSLSAFLRLAAKEFATRHAKTSNTGN